MFLGDIIKDGINGIADLKETRELVAGFEGDSVVLTLVGDKPLTFSVRAGRLVAEEGASESARANAGIPAREFLRFIDGRMQFGQLFTIEFAEYFKGLKGEFYDFGGDFMLLAPVSDRLTKLHREDAAFRKAVNAFASQSTS